MFQTYPSYSFTNVISCLPESYFTYFYVLPLNQVNSFNEFSNVSNQKNIFFGQFPSNTLQNDDNDDVLMMQSKLVSSQSKIDQNQMEQQKLTVSFKNKTPKDQTIERHDESYVPKLNKQRYQTAHQRYTKKNIEANIVNQIFSYLLMKEKSSKIIKRLNFDNHTKNQAFFQIMVFLKKKLSKNFNRNSLKGLCNFNQYSLGFSMINKKFIKKLDVLNLEEFSKIIRCAIRYFLSQVGCISILTSKRMRPQIWIRHLSKCRQLRQFLFEQEI